MVNKHVQRYCTSCVINKFQIKITMKYHCTPIRMARMLERREKKELSFIAGRNAKWNSHLENSLSNLNTLLINNPAIILFGICQRDLEMYVYTKTCTPLLRDGVQDGFS